MDTKNGLIKTDTLSVMAPSVKAGAWLGKAISLSLFSSLFKPDHRANLARLTVLREPAIGPCTHADGS